MQNVGQYSNSTPLFEGGDCEDCTQRICEIVNTIKANLVDMTKDVRQRLDLQYDPPCINVVFAPDSNITSRIYMARGIYNPPEQYDTQQQNDADVQKEGNHTFGVVGHRVHGMFYFSVVECVTALLVVHDDQNDGVKCEQIQQDFWRDMCKKKCELEVINTTEAANAYKHVLWVDMYMVFEYSPCQRNGQHEMLLSFGAGTYHTYADCITIDCDFTDEKAMLYELTAKMQQSEHNHEGFILLIA